MRLNIYVVYATTQFALDDLTEDMTFADVAALLAMEVDAPLERLDIFCDSKLLRPEENASKTLESLGFHDNMRIDVFNRSLSEAQLIPQLLRNLTSKRDSIRSNPYQLSGYKQAHPDFADAVVGPSIVEFGRFVWMFEAADRRQKHEESLRQQRMRANPFDLEAQRALEEEIRMENVETLRQEALEHMPESFAQVVMLYVDVVVNGHPVKAFVDSGAQMTIMSAACADRCGLARLIDRRFQGMAVGVGSQRILGRVHMHAVEIAGTHLPTSFSILEKQPMDMLLGLDMLRRHQCCIDLRENVLRIGSSGATTPFLSEQDLPAQARHMDIAGNSDDPQPAQPAAAAPAPAPLTAVVTDEAVASLQQLGFDRAAAVEALQRCGGDRQRAAEYLLALG